MNQEEQDQECAIFNPAIAILGGYKQISLRNTEERTPLSIRWGGDYSMYGPTSGTFGITMYDDVNCQMELGPCMYSKKQPQNATVPLSEMANWITQNIDLIRSYLAEKL
jgi:hypothetical protein